MNAPGKLGKVWFVGAGPGDPELITVKGRDLIARAGAILYAGSLVSTAALRWAKADCEMRDSKDMALEDIGAWLKDRAAQHDTVVRLQTGDPTLYGALIEMVQPLDAAGIAIGVVPGVSSAMAAAAVAVESLTLPEVTQTVIFTRVAGRTPMPPGESLGELARHHCTLCLFLSITLLHKVKEELLAAGWSADAPVLVVHKASWPGEEKVIRGTLADIRDRCRAEKINSQAMIIVSPVLGARAWPVLKKSKLYDAAFTHRFRKGASKPSVACAPRLDPIGEGANAPSLVRAPRLDPIGEGANAPSLVRAPRLDPIGEGATRPSLACAPRLDPIGETVKPVLKEMP